MKRKGICYDVGRVMLGNNWRPNFDPDIIHREIEIIKNDLHCNTIRICGQDINRLVTASEDALKQGLEVWFSPEIWDKNQKETHDYIVKAAVAAEELRKHHPEIVFSLGSELTIFMQGIIEGNNFFERINHPSFMENIKAGIHNKPLNAFLVGANMAIRPVFKGKVTYTSAPLETVDWSLFDFVCLDIYRDKSIKNVYEDIIKKYFENKKPVVIGEFGCCTYQGAEDMGARGSFIIDFSEDISKPPTRLNGYYIRDERVQALELTDELRLFDDIGVDGTFVFTFVQPTFKYNKEAEYDVDMASYSLVKSYSDKQGETYPDMSWEPKESFYAVSEYYSNDN